MPKSFIISLSNNNKHNHMEFFGCFGCVEFKFSIRDEVFQSESTWKLLANRLIVSGSYEIKSIDELIETVLRSEGYISVTDRDGNEFTLHEYKFINGEVTIRGSYHNALDTEESIFGDFTIAKAEMLAVIVSDNLEEARIEELMSY